MTTSGTVRTGDDAEMIAIMARAIARWRDAQAPAEPIVDTVLDVDGFVCRIQPIPAGPDEPLCVSVDLTRDGRLVARARVQVRDRPLVLH